MKLKKLISGVLALLLVVNTTAFAAESTQKETVKFIVELKEDSVLEELKQVVAECKRLKVVLWDTHLIVN